MQKEIFLLASTMMLPWPLYLHIQLLLYSELTSVFVTSWTYTNSNMTMNWTAAKAWCEENNSNLIVIQNKEENNYLKKYLPSIKRNYWIGLRRSNGSWIWEGTEKQLDSNEFWAQNEPNKKAEGEDCVEIYSDDEKKGQYNDDRCNKKKTALCSRASCAEVSCGKHANCMETFGNYTCQCDPGFTGFCCDEVMDPGHGFVQCDHIYGEFSFNSSCHYHCAHGYRLNGSQTLYCQASRKWDRYPTMCHALPCKKLLVPDGEVNCSEGINTICMVQCSPSHLLLSAHEYTCRPDGSWSHFQPLCASRHHLLMASSGCAVILSICCSACCCCYFWKRQSSLKQRNLGEVMNPVHAEDAPLEDPLSFVYNSELQI